MKYLFCEKWRSAINIGSIRVFDNTDDLRNHMIAVNWCKTHGHPFLYEVAHDKEPRLLREKEFCKLLNLRRHFAPTTNFDDFCIEVAKLDWLDEAGEDMISDAFRQVGYYARHEDNSELRKLKLIHAVVMAVNLSGVSKTPELVERLNSAFRTFTKDLGPDNQETGFFLGTHSLQHKVPASWPEKFQVETKLMCQEAIDNITTTWYDEKISQHVPKLNTRI